MDRKNREMDRKNENRPGTGSRPMRFLMSAVLLVMLSALLQGCALAREDLQEASWEQEQICGVLVTVGDPRSGMEERTDLEGRTFSSIQEMEEAMRALDIVEGVLTEDGSYAFADVQGHFFGIFEQEDAEGSFVHFVNDGSFADIKANTKVSDTGTERSMKAVVLAPPGLREPIYMNPVYQRSDGTVYVSLAGGGFLTGGIYEEDGSVTGGVHEEGEVYAQTFTSRKTKSVNGKEEIQTVELSVSCEISYPVKAVRLLEMSGENQLLNAQEISREMERVPLRQETAYVIVEEERTDGSFRRGIYDWEQKPEEEEGLIHEIWDPGADGLICPRQLLMVKQGQEEK